MQLHVRYLEFSVSQHGRLREAVPALHQVNHVQHRQEGQRDVDVAAGARALQVEDVIVVGGGCGVVGATKKHGGGRAEDGHSAESTPGQRGETAVHQQRQEEALPVGLSAQGGGQGLLGRLLLWEQTNINCYMCYMFPYATQHPP